MDTLSFPIRALDDASGTIFLQITNKLQYLVLKCFSYINIMDFSFFTDILYFRLQFKQLQ